MDSTIRPLDSTQPRTTAALSRRIRATEVGIVRKQGDGVRALARSSRGRACSSISKTSMRHGVVPGAPRRAHGLNARRVGTGEVLRLGAVDRKIVELPR